MAASELRGNPSPGPAQPPKRRASLEDEEEFSHPALVNRWRRERSTTTLTKMDGDFYERFDRYLRALHDDYQREQAVNAATPKVLILLDELTNLQRVRDDLYDLREKKIVTLAVIAARDSRVDKTNLTKEEETLFETVLRSLKEARLALLRKETSAPVALDPGAAAVAPKPAGGPPVAPEPVAPATAPPPPPAQPAAPYADRARAAEAAPEAALPGLEVESGAVGAGRRAEGATGSAEAHAPATATTPAALRPAPTAPSRVLVRVTQAIEPFVAPDLRHYRLQAEDVAALPRDVAHVLIARGLAAPVGA